MTQTKPFLNDPIKKNVKKGIILGWDKSDGCLIPEIILPLLWDSFGLHQLGSLQKSKFLSLILPIIVMP